MFTTPIVMLTTEEQFRKDLEIPLKEMGYKWMGIYDIKNSINTRWKYLCTNYSDIDTGIGCINYTDSRYFIEDYNPELFLALAAMTDSQYGVKGEYWKFTGIFLSEENFTTNKLYKANRSLNNTGAFIGDNNNLNGYWGVNNLKFFVKATKEELIKHFSKQIIKKGDTVAPYYVQENLCNKIKTKLRLK